MPEQYDYGSESNGRTLVPGALTVFRHFSLNTRTRQLQPMNYTDPQAAMTGGIYYNEFERQRPYAVGEGGRVYEAECIRPRALYARLANPEVREPHHAPTLDCSCGFYASYDPATDFYEGAHWGPSWARERRNTYADMGELILVRAVVEVTGAVVMGRKGVRAAKMKIVALAVDHAKYLPPREDVVWETPTADPYDIGDFLSSRAYYYPRVETLSMKERRDADTVTEAVADAYGARFYPRPGDMYAEHPPADVAALGVDTSERRYGEVEDDAWLNYLAGINVGRKPTGFATGGLLSPGSVSQVQAAIDSAADSLKTITDLFGNIGKSGGTMQPYSLEPETKKERALRLKKNRPAPPGTGIDRRRGRLR